MDARLLARSEAYLDAIFGPGAGARHSYFLEHIADPALRETLHRYHALQADTEHLSVRENYLIGMCVLAAEGCLGPAAMFARALMHLGVPREKILAAVGRTSMWIGGIRAADASAHIQRAVRDYERRGLESLAPWFPEPPGVDDCAA